MQGQTKSDLFEFMLERVKDVAKQYNALEPQAFGRWFANLYFTNARDFFVSDGSNDGKIDLFFNTDNGKTVRHHILNTKFTREFNKLAPQSFYQEIQWFGHAFANKEARSAYLEKSVKKELRPRYNQLFNWYDNDEAELVFVTNHRCNEGNYEQVRDGNVKVVHMDDLLQYMADDIDGAMPRTQPIELTGIHTLLAADRTDTEVATSIVFARLLDFIRYMKDDTYDLLFNRNVRVAISTSKSKVNRDIRNTFQNSPKEFAFSNNGITMLCEKQSYDPGQKILRLENPRVVNGSQTLHSVRDVPTPSANARVMVRIIEIEPPKGDGLEEKIKQRKDVIAKIAMRSNQQNPIKSWDLASNDDFQMDLYRFFRGKNFYYERRNREWQDRSREMRSIGIQNGINIKKLTQLISCYYSLKPKLGPAGAKNVALLFEGAIYEYIRETPPELAFQLFLLHEVIHECLHNLSREKVYIRNMETHAYFALYSLLLRLITDAGGEFGKSSLTLLLHKQWENYYPVRLNLWKKLTKLGIDHIADEFKKNYKLHSRSQKEPLTYVNYFKNQSMMLKLLKRPVSRSIRIAAQAALQG